ncbi:MULTISPECIES: hypothetical protein [Tsukamurella]|uniref:Uncharacterized protein n=2 Tax=Tsukamurella TaxID=2060 RepID=A0A5C5RY11_9ACTN|nr:MULTISPECIES: hypothetical protein [Tsukamurella]NMD55574.1 hypothetical protein [Tsukamurella columbiensis]TWS27320.1 hypothetical protein FK530_19445 [Tsukamurella conjunctivitidis]
MTNPNTPFIPPQMLPVPLYRQPVVVAALIVFAGLIFAGLMVWQPFAKPDHLRVHDTFTTTKSCVTYKSSVSCN